MGVVALMVLMGLIPQGDLVVLGKLPFLIFCFLRLVLYLLFLKFFIVIKIAVVTGFHRINVCCLPSPLYMWNCSSIPIAAQ